MLVIVIVVNQQGVPTVVSEGLAAGPRTRQASVAGAQQGVCRTDFLDPTRVVQDAVLCSVVRPTRVTDLTKFLAPWHAVALHTQNTTLIRLAVLGPRTGARYPKAGITPCHQHTDASSSQQGLD